jgi:hypothetical protein
MDLRRRRTVEGLFVEGRFDTDPNSLHFRRSVVDAIVDTAETAFEEETTMVVCHLHIVPPPKENPGKGELP